MFKKVFLPLSIALSLLWVVHCVWLRGSDLKHYASLMHEQQQVDISSKLLSQNAYQTRSGVRKDIWTSEEGKIRLHYRIESDSSLLKLLQLDNRADIVENLQGIRCWMQDKLYFGSQDTLPMQQVRYLEADEGVYRYHSHQFDAHSVSLSLVRRPGHQLTFDLSPKDAFLKGIAQNITFSISEGTPQFQAEQFRASLKGDER
jgi:hypothetical protein